jgi:Rrf2 family protein
MKISTKGRYALRIMFYLAIHNNGNYIALREISEHENISIKYMEQITAVLSKFGLLSSVRGPSGGYKLSRNPDKYTVGEIIFVTEGDSPFVEPAGESASDSDRIMNDVIWEPLQKHLEDFLKGITLEDLVNKYNSDSSLMYMI